MGSASRSRRRRRAARFSFGAALVLVGLWVWFPGRARHPEATRWPSVTLADDDRLLVLAPHPDDEVLGCGGIIQEALARRIPVRVVFFTYGDNNQWSFLVYRKHPVLVPNAVRGMGLVRHDEALAAGRLLGLAPEQLTFLGYPDFGTFSIWTTHWGRRPPFQSMLTRVTAVPYANALRPGASYKGEEVLRDLETILREFRPTKVFVSHPGDHMPDHQALYLFTRVALWDLDAEMRPELFPYLIHFRRWPSPRGYRPRQFLEPPAIFRNDADWHVLALAPPEVERKHLAIQAHRSQYNYSARYLLSFIRPNELFGDFRPEILGTSVPAVQLVSGDGAAGKIPEELTEQERAAFVGVETRTVQLDGDALVLSIGFSRPLARAVEASVYLFGYRRDRPFAEMPKLHVKLGALQTGVYDQERALPEGVVQLIRQPRRFVIRVPLRVLGDPERVLTSARTYLGDVPLDWVSWRVLELATTH